MKVVICTGVERCTYTVDMFVIVIPDGLSDEVCLRLYCAPARRLGRGWGSVMTDF